jgi:dihydrofolate synthase/folylpolyglutamate synthase
MNFFETLKEYECMTPGLTRIKKFFESIGNPQNKVKAIHIAGTNGKGSTAVFISEILKLGGYKTALYLSPHLIDITERIKINDQNISIEVFNSLSTKYLEKAIKYKLSYFEYLTALAFIYFESQKIDIAVIETGLGGRFDATNIIKNSLVCIITSIAKDHQEVLGNTIKEIAFEKAGIIKKTANIICGKLPTDAISVIKNKASNLHLYGTDFKSLNNTVSVSGQYFDYISENAKLNNIELKLLGKHQVVNASVAICAIEVLNNSGYYLNETSIRMGLKNTIFPGRFDLKKVCICNKSFELIIDGAHNIQGIGAFLETFKQLGFSKKKIILIFAIMREKKYDYIIKKILPFSKKVILPKINNNRAVSPDILQIEFLKYFTQNKIYIASSVEKALDMIDDGETVMCVGSFYLVGEILKIIQ